MVWLKDSKSGAVSPLDERIPSQDPDLLSRIDTLRKEVEDLRHSKIKATALTNENTSLKSQNVELQQQYDDLLAKLKSTKEELRGKDKEIENLTTNNDKLGDKILKLKSDYNTLDKTTKLEKDRDSDLLRECKDQCQKQIRAIEKNMEGQFKELRQTLDQKESNIITLEDSLRQFKNSTLPRLQQEAQQNLTAKQNEIQQLQNKNANLKKNIDEVTNDKDIAENKLKRSETIVKDLKQNLKTIEDELELVKEQANKDQTQASNHTQQIHDLNDKISKKDTEIAELKRKRVELEDQINSIETKVREIHSLAETYAEQLGDDTVRSNPTVKIIIDELAALLPEANSPLELSDKTKQIKELLLEKDKLDKQVEQLKLDIENAVQKGDRHKQDYDRLQKENEKLDSDTKEAIKSKNDEIEQLNNQIDQNSTQLEAYSGENEQLKNNLKTEKEMKEKLENILKKYRNFASRICDVFKYSEEFKHDEESPSKTILESIFPFLDKKRQDKESELSDLRAQLDLASQSATATGSQLSDLKSKLSKAESQAKILSDQLQEASDDLADKNQQIHSLAHEIETLRAEEAEGEDKDEEELKYKRLIEEKNEILSNHTQTLESMKSTILKLRNNIQENFDDIEAKKEEIEGYKQKIAEQDSHIKQKENELHNKNIEVEEINKRFEEGKTQKIESEKKIKEQQEQIEGYKREIENTKTRAENKIEENKLSLLSTVNSHLVALGVGEDLEQEINRDQAPSSDELFGIVIQKIQKIPASLKSSSEVPGDVDNTLKALEEQNQSLTNQLRDFKDTLDKKEKDFKFISMQRDNLRQQLESAVSYINSRDNQPTSPTHSDALPSLQSQLQVLQDDSKYSEATRDLTEQIIDNFEKNDRLLREKIQSLQLQNSDLKSRAQRGSRNQSQGHSEDSEHLRTQLTADIKKKIREEEVAKRDKEIERQRKLMAAKSEEQSIQFNQKVEELEAKYEAKDEELTECLIKLQEANHEINKLKSSTKERTSTLSPFEKDLDDLADSTKEQRSSQNKYDDQMRVLKRIEELDEKIIDLTEKITNFRSELGDRMDGELEEINNFLTTSTIMDLGEKTMQKLQQLKDANMVVQIVRKITTEGYNWLLLEKKDPLDKPLEIKTSQSMSKSSMEYTPPGRKLLWVCEETLKEDMLEYVYSFTPAFLLESNSIKIEIGDLFNNESDYKSYKLLVETTKELMEKRMEIIKESREIRLGLRRENFLFNEAISVETEERIRDLENKNLEYEDEIQSLNEENSDLNLRNKELSIFINLLNIRLKEMNQLVYDFSRDKPKEDYIATNANLIKEIDQIKSEKMMLDAEMKKIRDAIENKQKLRVSNPKKGKGRDVHSPNSFIFDGEVNELFDDSLIIDTSNKEYEERLQQLEAQIEQLEVKLSDKDDIIESLKATIDEMEAESSKLPEVRKSESFEMMNNDNIKHIKDVLFKFLKNVPYTDPSNEALVEIVFSMLHMKEQEIKEIKESREKISDNNKTTPKKQKTQGRGLFGGMFGKK